MAPIKSRKHAAVSSVALAAPAALGLLMSGLPAAAQTTSPETNPTRGEATLSGVKVKGEQHRNDFKTSRSASTKATEPLLDQPRTIQVITKEVLHEQGASSLMEALRNTPGITMQLGENGNTSAGDAFTMRGFSTQSSTFVDGLRDLGAVSRDVFNVEQVEVVRGPSGSESGRGASSGYINLISKLPSQEDFSNADFTLGTAKKKRVSADLNRTFNDGKAAFRLNVMGQDSGVPGRDVVENRGTAIAPSIAFGLGTPTRLYLYSQHVRQHNKPDGGVPTIGMVGSTTAGAPVDRSNYYGSRNDHEKVDADMFTAKVEHDLSPVTRVTSLTRYGRTHMDRVLTGINATTTTAADPAAWTVARSRQRVDQLNEILAHQTNVRTEFETAGLKNALAAGVELSYERQKTLGFGTAAATLNGTTYAAVASPAANLYSPNADDVMGIPYATGANTDGKVITTALYAFDTLSLTEQLKLNAGFRFERYNLSTDSGTVVTATNAATYPGYAVNSVAPTSLNKTDNLLSWNVGAVYKPVEIGTVYVAYANSYTPPGGANFALSGTTTNQASPTLDPQETQNIELGTKWDLLDRRLSLSAAAYRTENDKQTSYDAATSSTLQFGKTRVQGIELAAVGQLTNFWQVTAGVAKMSTKALDQFSAVTTNNVVTGVTPTTGVRWSPDLSATVWTSYTLGDFTLGGGARYQSSLKRVIAPSATVPNMPNIPGYTVVDLMAAYRVSKNVNLRLNVYNLFDKKYIGAPNNSGARLVLGAPRSASVTASLMF